MSVLFVKQILLLMVVMAPLLYLVYRTRGKSILDLVFYSVLILFYIIIHRNFVFGRQFVFHDTLWAHHSYYAVIHEWIKHGYSIGWNPFMNGGEPLYLYSNLFLWAELFLISLLNKLFLIPTHELVNLYFTYIFISYFTFCFVVFSILFWKRTTVFFPTVVLIFSGFTASNLGQYVISPLYLAPLAFLSVYLFLKTKKLLYLAWTFFFVSVTANHYLFQYLALFLLIFICSWLVSGYLITKKNPFFTPLLTDKKKISIILILFLITLLPALFVFAELKDSILPARGDADIKQLINSSDQILRGGVNLPLKNYAFLLTLPSAARAIKTGGYLTYYHSVYYVGIIALILLFLSYTPSRVYYASLLSLFILICLALGNSCLIWRLLSRYVPFFILRHSYSFSQVICFLIIILSAFGFRNLIINNRFGYAVISLTLLLSAYVSSKAANYTTARPMEILPFRYPESRSLYSRNVLAVAFDVTPLMGNEAVASNPYDVIGNTVLMRKKAFHKLLKQSPESVTGQLFVFTKNISLDDLPGKGSIGNLKVEYIKTNNPNWLRIKAKIPEKGFLVRRENFHPGWKAKINNKNAVIKKFADTFQAVEVEKGEIIVDFIFSSFYPALALLHVTAVLVGYFLFFRALTRPQESICYNRKKENLIEV